MTDVNPIVTLVGRPVEPGLESTLAAIRLGAAPAATALDILAAWPLIVLDAVREEGLSPLLLQRTDGATVVAAYTSPDRIRKEDFGDRRMLWVRGSVLARGAAPGVGISINHASAPALIVAPDMVAELRARSAILDPQPYGSRPLTPLELAIMKLRSGIASMDGVLAALPEAALTIASSTDPAADGPSPAWTQLGGRRLLLAWTDPNLVRGFDGSTFLQVRGADLPGMLGQAMPPLLLNPQTGYQLAVDPTDRSDP